MNGVCTIHNPKDSCPNSSIKLGTRFAMLTDSNTNINVGHGIASYIGTGFEWREFGLCEYPVNNAPDKVPKDSMFTINNDTCPKDSSEVGTVAVLDSTPDTNNDRFTINAVIKPGGPFLQYRYLLPKLCRADRDISINEHMILPAKNCNASTWSDKGIFGMLRPVSETGIFVNKFDLDPHNQVMSGYYIIRPRLCIGQPNELVNRCSNKMKYGIRTRKDAEQCDNDMKKLCATIEYGSDPICSCYNSPLRILGNPVCIDRTCFSQGYKTQGMLTTPCNISNNPIDCSTFNKIKESFPNIELIDNVWTQYCFVPEKPDIELPPPKQIIERSTGDHWFTETRIFVFTILLILFLFFAYLLKR